MSLLVSTHQVPPASLYTCETVNDFALYLERRLEVR